MSQPAHGPYDFSVYPILVANGVGVPTMERIVAVAAAELAARWGTGNPDLVDPVMAVEYAQHTQATGSHLVINRRRRYFDAMACGPVRAAALDEICATAQRLGHRIEPGFNAQTGVAYRTITTRSLPQTRSRIG